MRQPTFVAVTAVASALVVGVLTAGATAAVPGAGLDAQDAELLARAEAKGEPSVTLLIAADTGETREVGSELEQLGGTVSRRFDGVGYVRAEVPTSAVLKAARVPGVNAVDLDQTIRLPDPRPAAESGSQAAAPAPVTGPSPSTPATNPFMPVHEIGAVAFRQRHPSWDGRGVTIGIVDTGVDVDNPALQTTTTGERKIVDWVTATDPVADGDPTWRRMDLEVSGPTFSADGVTWTAPTGAFRFDGFREWTVGSEVGGDVNRDGDSNDAFGVLYDPASGDVRVDVDQNLDFTDDPAMRSYRERFDIGHFGSDNPSTPVREQMPFVIELRRNVFVGSGQTADFVNIGIVTAAHGSHVAGIAAANDMLGNPLLDGAAPGAKLVSSRACLGSCSLAATTDGMLDLVVNRHVDVVNMSIGGLQAFNDGSDARSAIYNRLIRDYGVQLIFSGGNDGPGMNTSGNPAVATDVVSVAASVSKATWLANYGSVTRVANQLFNFSSRGPREDGGFKPNISAPGSAISTTPLWQPGFPTAEAGYPLPPGLQMFNGTSMAAPAATGGAALLLSAAKAANRAVTPAALRRALYSSARPIAGASTYGQGNGLVDVNGAWSLLAGGVATRGYVVDAPVCTALSSALATPGRGTGIYNRCPATAGGHRAGQSKTYAVTITRTSGPAGAIRHRLVWVGNDGTFQAPASVNLPLNGPVTISVVARPAAGAHGAILRIDDPATPVVDHELSNVVVASNTPTAPLHAFATVGSVDRNLSKSYFVTVPAGAAVLQLNLLGLRSGSQVRFIAINPEGVPVDPTSTTLCYTNFSDPATCKPNERSYENPQPGVWEIEVESRRTSPALDNPFALAARIQGVTVSPKVVALPSAPVGQPTPVSWNVTNAFGPVRFQARGAPLASTFSARPSIATDEVQRYDVTVPAGATKFEAVIGNTSAADLDLVVFRDGEEVASSADGDSEEAVTIDNPLAGAYQVRVIGFDVPGGPLAYDYRDTISMPGLGSLDMAPAFATVGNGASRTVSGTVTPLVAPPAGRKLSGELTIVTDEGAVVGNGSVEVG